MNARIRLDQVRKRIARACARVGRNPADVTLVAVSKTHPPQDVAALNQAGQAVFAESYVQEALPKMDALADLHVRWHFIGRLQKNKVKYVAGRFDLIHSIDSIELARMLHKKCAARGIIQPVLVQVNLACETQKAGCSLEGTLPLAQEVRGLSGLKLEGLMLLPPWDEDPEANRSLFAQAAKLKHELADRLGQALPVLSMGMSHDLEQAVEEGATMVRVGTDLFGERNR
ncbi:MAG: YggS family pyridoxal phosphate-dependent enzyme [Desulfovibrio sp.]|nr:YggS family pyridoxal phosphate-dependent enzyme [Desulfovibrio sp.]MBI4961615.1 YggS family pyridoxal phosphate-dependent enzyme [Desulfovibrio sp.]